MAHLETNMSQVGDQEGLLATNWGEEPDRKGIFKSFLLNKVGLKIIFFIVESIIFAGGLLSLLELLSFGLFVSPCNAIDSVLIMVGALASMMLDVPDVMKEKLNMLKLYDRLVTKYIAFLTLYVGRGLWFIALGSLTGSALWHDEANFVFIGVFGGIPMLCGTIMVLYGWLKMKKVHDVQKYVKTMMLKGQLPSLYQRYAKTSTVLGLTPREFASLAKDIPNTGKRFSQEEMTVVFNALCQDKSHKTISTSYLALHDIDFWAKGRMVLM